MLRVLLFALAALALPVQAQDLKPFSASYTADWKQLPVGGSATRSLKAESDGRWNLDFEASMLVAGLTEQSTFRVESGSFLPQTYRFKRSGLGKSKQVELDFDWSAKQVIGSDRGNQVRVPLNRGLLDKSTYQIALQHDTPVSAAVIMGVMTGVAGGVMRDVLCNEIPMIFQKEVYATACIAGSLVFIVLQRLEVTPWLATGLSMATVLLARLAAIRWRLGLPRFHLLDRF